MTSESPGALVRLIYNLLVVPLPGTSSLATYIYLLRFQSFNLHMFLIVIIIFSQEAEGSKVKGLLLRHPWQSELHFMFAWGLWIT